MAQVTDDERERICAALREGKSVGKVAREFGRSTPTVSRIAKQAGIDVLQYATEKARAAKTTYDRANRIRLIDLALEKAETLVNLIEKPGGMYNWSMALAVLLDKRRQEDDQSGSRRGWIRQLVEGLACDATT
jgi:IS30 family transposase